MNKEAIQKRFNLVLSLLDLRQDDSTPSYEKEEASKYAANILRRLSEQFSRQLTDEEVRLGQTQGKLQAIKAYRNRTECSLREAKNIVEEFFDWNGYAFFNTFHQE